MRKKMIMAAALAAILLGLFFLFREWNKTDYQKITEKFEAVNVDEINQKIKDKESFMLYVGSEECPYCVEFVKLLGNKYNEDQFELSYLDEKKGDTPEKIQSFRNQYKIQFVPRVLVINEGKVLTPETPRNQEEVNQFIEEGTGGIASQPRQDRFAT